MGRNAVGAKDYERIWEAKEKIKKDFSERTKTEGINIAVDVCEFKLNSLERELLAFLFWIEKIQAVFDKDDHWLVWVSKV
ncbi:MAG: hypothetical protein Q8O83_00215 [bacterium]|nr:hypothetical protein [bacterium]